MATDMDIAGVVPGKRLVFVLEYSGGGTYGEVDHVEGNIIFLNDGRRLNWLSVLWVTDDDNSVGGK